jgi:hypothetical protein
MRLPEGHASELRAIAAATLRVVAILERAAGQPAPQRAMEAASRLKLSSLEPTPLMPRFFAALCSKHTKQILVDLRSVRQPPSIAERLTFTTLRMKRLEIQRPIRDVMPLASVLRRAASRADRFQRERFLWVPGNALGLKPLAIVIAIASAAAAGMTILMNGPDTTSNSWASEVSAACSIDCVWIVVAVWSNGILGEGCGRCIARAPLAVCDQASGEKSGEASVRGFWFAGSVLQTQWVLSGFFRKLWDYLVKQFGNDFSWLARWRQLGKLMFCH